MVTGVLADAKAEFSALIERQGMDPDVAKVELKVDDRYWLEERKPTEQKEESKSKDQNMNKCFGGVILTN